MSTVRLSGPALLLLGCLAFANGPSPQWMKLDQALAAGRITGRPVCVYAVVDENGKGACGTASGNVDKALREEESEELLKQFSMVRCADAKTAKRIKPGPVPALVYFDGDGEAIHRAVVRTEEEVRAAFQAALKRYASREIAWASGDFESVLRKAGELKRPVALVFVDGKSGSNALVKVLEDRWIAKHHDRLVFLSIPYKRDSEDCRRWGVTSSPALLVLNPLEEKDSRRVLSRLSGRKDVRSARACLLKALEKFRKSLEE